MSRKLFYFFLLPAFLFLNGTGFAATYYVSTNGVDTNVGSQAAPWQTIARGVSAAQKGDTVIVTAGYYDEHVSTARGGTNEATRIHFKAEGTATMRGFTINHPYVTVDGFDIARHYAANKQAGSIEVVSTGDNFEVINNTIRDGIWVIRDDLIFTHNTDTNDTISSATGGFINAGFKPGMSVNILLASLLKNTALTNKDTVKLISGVTDNVLTLQTNQTVVSEGPARAMLDASYCYGIVVNAGASWGVVRSNLVSNLGYDGAWVGGEFNLYQGNTFEKCNGWEAMHWFGISNVFRGNFIRNSKLLTYSNLSPDVFETWGGAIAHHVTFESNFVSNFEGVIGILRDPFITNYHDITFQRNVFVDVSFSYVRIANVAWKNNTFLRVADHVMDAAQADPHPLEFQSLSGQYSADGAVVQNNIFVGCGDQSKSADAHGWYNFSGVTNFLASNNFVAGPSPAFASKPTFNEGVSQLNGGDPGFVNINDPLGPDGIPFTDDDGLRLRPDSKLRGKASDGGDIGAYSNPVGPPLSIKNLGNSSVEIAWGVEAAGYQLQTTPQLASAWSPIMALDNSTNSFRTNTGNGAIFFRLAK